MAGFLVVGLFECGLYFWTGEELISEVSSTPGIHWKYWNTYQTALFAMTPIT
jgi:hypothetical protein